MDDMGILARDFGFGPGGAKPISAKFSDVFGEPAKFKPNTNYSTNYEYSSMKDFEYDYIFNEDVNSVTGGSIKTSSAPVYDKPVYDDADADIFDGLPGLKSKSAGNYDNDFDDLLGNSRLREKATENIISSSSSKSFDHLLAGSGRGISTASNRPITESNLSSLPVGGSKYGSVLDESFVGLESVLTQGSSSYRVFQDPMKDISKHGKSRSASAEASSGGSGRNGDSDPLDSFEKPAHSFPLGRDKGGKEISTSRSASPQFVAMGEQNGSSSFRYSGSNMVKKTPFDDFTEPPISDIPKFSTNVRTFFYQTTPQYFEASSQVDMSSTSSGQHSDDKWLTASEIPLFTQPTAAPPPSRPPPPIPHQRLREETVFSSSSSNKKGDKFPSTSNPSQHLLPQSPKSSRPVTERQFDELEDFSLGRSENSLGKSANLHSSEDHNSFSAYAAASAAAMKEAMEKAEAKFRHAKDVREKEYAKAGRYKEPVQLEKDEQYAREKYLKETGDRLESERKQKEEEEREQRRLQKDMERAREIEREKARQAVERANREARERAAAQAREKAAIEARLRCERAAVEKANAEARERAGRVAVQRAQAAAEASDRVTTAEMKEKKLGEKDFAARAEVEAKRRAERGAVERAIAEARERAAAEARERAAVANGAKVNQQRNDDDLESFFSKGRASSAPKARVDSTHLRNKGGSEPGNRPPSSSGASSNMKKVSSTTNIVDDLSSIFGAPTAGKAHEVEGETEERRRARLVRDQRTQERAAKALAEKNQRDLQAQREQEERHRFAENFDIEIKRWAAGKEGNLRGLLSTLQYVLWPECGWQPVSLTDIIDGASVKRVYRKATLCIHPDKVQQKGATLQQKYIAEKVFDLLMEAKKKFDSEELF